MAAADVHRLNLRPGFECQNICFYLNHPIQFICAAGIIVARDEQERRSILVLDDSSGACLEVVCSKNTQEVHSNTNTITSSNTNNNNMDNTTPSQPTHLTSATKKPLNITPLLPGVRAKLKGTISYFRGMFQLCLERYEMLHNMTAEVHFWDERTRFRLQVLCVPWVVTQEEVEKLRGEAEGLTAASAARIGGVGGCDVDLNADGHVVARRRKEERERERERDRERRRVEREERDCLRIEKRYEREEVVREILAKRCREKSVLVGRKQKKGKWLKRLDV
ncbi:OB-fold nucleic acid binding domain-containing protein [Histoplasma capsulatum var. duboisii H88]|uniref:OB-fold nucleic acid binding domain-containing protein n=1 Tax=Ajellomyces capsulatus (strain H88) TaxID=544711 RepID=F0UUK1_AJEC8|nr:OB-fold nucleic acid binding domain-containing protein [Histoplasma capsulatum var. duboisii H88]